MTEQLREQLAGWDGVRRALGALSHLNREYETFFGEVLDQLGWLGAALADRAEHLRARSASTSASPAEGGADLVAPLVEELRRQQATLAETQQTIAKEMEQLAGLAEQVDRTARELAELRHGQDDEVRERAELEAQLELVRQRAVEMSAALEAEQAKAARQEALWGEELQRIRRAVEQRLAPAGAAPSFAPNRAATRAPVSEGTSAGDAPWWRDGEPAVPSGRAAAPSANPTAPAPAAAVEAPDPVLDSVLAQFEMLQKDIARRRAEVRP